MSISNLLGIWVAASVIGMFLDLLIRNKFAFYTVTAVFIVAPFALAATAFLGFAITGNKVDSKPYVVHEIVSLNDNFQVHGKFGRISGSIDEDLYYTYGYKTPSGGIKTQNVACRNAEVFLSDNTKPKTEWYHNRCKFWFVYGDDFPVCKIYLPTDAVISEYLIDFN